MKKMVKRLVIPILLLLLIPLALAADDCIYYFTGDGDSCPGCRESDSFITTLQQNYPDLQIETYEVYHDLTKRDLLTEYFTSYNVDEKNQGIPVVFLGESYLIGNGPIQELLEGSLQDNNFSECPTQVLTPVVGVVGEKSPHNVLATLPFGVLTGGALTDALTAAGLALILILLLLLLAVQDKKKLVSDGVSFIINIFIFTFIFGLTMLNIGAKRGLYLTKIIAVIAIIIGITKIWHFFKVKDLPEKYQKFLKKLTSKAGVIVIGIVSAFMLLPFTSSKFLILTELVKEHSTRSLAFFMYLYYCIILMVPLAIVLYVMYRVFHKSDKKVSKKEEKKQKAWKIHYLKKTHMMIGIILFILGLIALFL